MTTKLDTIITSAPVPKESDVNAPVSFSFKKTKVAGKADKLSKKRISEGIDYKTVDRRAEITIGINTACGVVGVPVAFTTGTVGYIYGGTVGAAVGVSLPVGLTCGVACGTLSYLCCPEDGRERAKEVFKKSCGCVERCQVKRSKGEASPELEAVIIEQPTAKSPSPEPAPAKRGWLI
ncbi:MAG: hypothetical protein OXF02_04005 [Simkaniaceae bacterium]|nr:hypothetical protein [Simkaniaceae bacterium]